MIELYCTTHHRYPTLAFKHACGAIAGILRSFYQLRALFYVSARAMLQIRQRSAALESPRCLSADRVWPGLFAPPTGQVKLKFPSHARNYRC